MKRKILIISFILISFAGYAQGILGLITRSENFFGLITSQKFADAQLYFDDVVKDQVTPAALQAVWGKVIGEMGSLESLDGAQSQKSGDYTSIIIVGKFEKGTQGFRFVYNKAEKLVGFTLLAKNTDAVYAKPAYADTSRYKETYINIGPAGKQLAGILTTPRTGSNFPVIVLVHGSGAGDMDETVGPNKPFKDLAAGLAAKGIATIRYVKRTLIYANDFRGAFTVKEEVLDDALAAIALAKANPQLNKKQIYVMGHSLGGMLAPRIASLAPDLSGIILASAPARKMTDLMVEQNMNMFARSNDTTKAGKAKLENVLKVLDATRITKAENMKPDSMIVFAPVTYWVDMNLYDQIAAAKKVKGKILVLQGGNDIQVSEEDYKLWKAALETKKNASFKFYPAIDHLLSPQTEKDWSGAYKKQVNVADYVINDIAAWVLAD